MIVMSVATLVLQPSVAALEAPVNDETFVEDAILLAADETIDIHEEVAMTDTEPAVNNEDAPTDIAESEQLLDVNPPELTTYTEEHNSENIAPPSVEPPALLSPRISEVQVSGTREFVEIYNPNDETLSLDGVVLRYYNATNTASNPFVTGGKLLVDLDGIKIDAKKFLVLDVQSLADTGAAIALVKNQSELVDQVAWGGESIKGGFFVAPAKVPAKDQTLQRCFVSGQLVDASVRDTSLEFLVYKNELPTPGSALECLIDASIDPADPTDPGVVNKCEGLRISEIGANLAQQFVELHNTLDEPINMAGCRVMTNRSASAYFALPETILPADEYFIVAIDKTPLILTKTTTGTVYLLSSDGAEIDSQSYANLAKDTAWALVYKEWKQTYSVTPGALNVYQQYLPCTTGYERNEETGRCRKIVQLAEQADCGEGKYRSEETNRCRNLTVESTLRPCTVHQYRNPATGRCRNATTATSSLTPCKAGQSRNPTTNRCRNITSMTSTLTPCKAGQVRNPATNRCKAVATTASTLKPCAVGQERNPATNRCRKVAQGDANAGFKIVESDKATDHVVSWLALGAIGSMALGYGAWEWRREVFGILGKAFGSLPFIK